MINKVILKGNVGKDPHVSLDQKGRQIATFSLATSTTWKDANGEWHQHVDWHQIVVFRESTARWIKDALKKGDAVYVEGKLTYHQKTDKFNQLRLIPNIVIAGFNGKVEQLRSKGPPPHSWIEDIGEQEHSHEADFENTSSPKLAKAIGGA